MKLTEANPIAYRVTYANGEQLYCDHIPTGESGVYECLPVYTHAVDKAAAWDAIAEKNEKIEKLKSLLVRVDALGRTGGWRRMPNGSLFCSTPLAGDISAALEQSKEK